MSRFTGQRHCRTLPRRPDESNVASRLLLACVVLEVLLSTNHMTGFQRELLQQLITSELIRDNKSRREQTEVKARSTGGARWREEPRNGLGRAPSGERAFVMAAGGEGVTCMYEGCRQSYEHQQEGSAHFAAVTHDDRDGTKTLREPTFKTGRSRRAGER